MKPNGRKGVPEQGRERRGFWQRLRAEASTAVWQPALFRLLTLEIGDERRNPSRAGRLLAANPCDT